MTVMLGLDGVDEGHSRPMTAQTGRHVAAWTHLVLLGEGH